MRRKNNQKQKRFGFTIVEVSLFLAITGLLFLSVTIGVQNSIYQQRYNDVVQSFTNFVRNVYDEAMNVQSISSGRHGMAIYGKMISFGEYDDDGRQIIYVYDVIGKAVSSGDIGSGGTLELLQKLGADIVFRESIAGAPYKLAGIIESYEPSWGARIQKARKADGAVSFADYTGAILVLRDPKSGTVKTFVKDDEVAIEAKQKVQTFSSGGGGEEKHILTEMLNLDTFKPKTVDFCINPNGTGESNRRTDIRLLSGASNSSGVEMVGLDDNNPDTGNKCNN